MFNFYGWLCKTFGARYRNGTRRVLRRRRPMPRPSLELLEDRVQPSVVPGGTITPPHDTVAHQIDTEGQQVLAGSTLLQFADTAPDLASLSATINWGDGGSDTVTSGSPAPAKIVFVGMSGGNFLYDVNATANSHVYEEFPLVTGAKAFNISVTDSTDNSNTIVGVDFGVPNDAPLTATGGFTFNATEGVLSGPHTVATFTDAGGGEGVTATINWGDGKPNTLATLGNGITNNAGTLTVSGSHIYDDDGTFPITVTFADEGGATAGPVMSSAPVAEGDLVVTTNTITATEGTPTGVIPVATFTDADNPDPIGNYTATIDWGDQSALDTGTITQNFSNANSLLTNGGFEQPVGFGQYATIPGWTLAPGTGGGTIEIAGNNIGTPFEGNQFTELNSQGAATIFQTVPTVVGQTYQLNFAFSARPGTTPADNDVAVTINGTPITTITTDGSTLADTSWTVYTFTYTATSNSSTIQFASLSAPADGVGGLLDDVNFDPASGYTVSGNHTYTDEGTPPVTVTVTENNAPGSFSNTAAANVADADVLAPANPQPVIATVPVEGAASGPLTLATFTTTYTSNPGADFAVFIDWNDGTTLDATSGTVTNDGNGNLTVTSTGHTFKEEGNYTITVTIQDGGTNPANSSSTTNTVTVSDPAVIVTGVAPFTPVEGQSFTGTVATFTDPGDPMGNVEPITDYAAQINWGDGTSSVGTITGPTGASNTYTVTGTHTYAEESGAEHAGSQPYQITVAVAHETAGQNVVANGGFETGDFTDWTVVDPSNFTVVDNGSQGDAPGPHSGSFAAALGAVGSLGTVSQTIPTIAGQQYVFSYFLESDGATPNEFSASFGGTQLFDQTDIPAQPYTFYSFTVTATSSSTAIQFGEQNDESFLYLDDVSVVAIPFATDTATVSDQAVVLGSTVTALPTINEGNNTGTQVVATFTDPGGAEAASDYSATIDWGDGTTSAGTINSVFDNANNLLTNGSFEQPQGAGGYATIPGWTLAPGTGGGTIEIGNFQTAFDGNQFTELNSNAPATIFQTVPTVAGQTYQLSFAFSARVGTTLADNDVAVSISGTPITTVTADGTGLADSAWTVYTFTYTATSSSSTIQFASLSPPGDTVGGLIDAVNFDPASFTVTGSHTYTEESTNNDAGPGNSGGVFNITTTVTHESATPSPSAVTATIEVDDVPVVATTPSSVSIFGTGVDANGTPLADGASDPHYTIIASADPSITTPQQGVVVLQNGFPIPPWVADSATSKWIAPQADESVGNSGGNYDYQTTFDLTGFDANSASISGQVAVDDSVEIFLDGVDTGIGASGFSAFTPFTISTGFQPGVNTLDFVVTNNGAGPTGLRVDGMSVTANSTFTASEGIPSAVQPLATFTDPGGAETPADYAATVTWGDGTSNTTGDSSGTVTITGPDANGVFTVNGSHTYAEEDGNAANIQVDITHENTATQTVLDPLTVLDPSLTNVQGQSGQHLTEGQPGDVVLATFQDPGNPTGDLSEPTEYTADVNWGDGTPTQLNVPITVTYSGGMNGTFTVTATHDFIEESTPDHGGDVNGNFDVTVQLHHEATTDPAPVTTTVTVDDPAVVAGQGQTVISGVEGSTTNLVLLATFTDPGDPNGNVENEFGDYVAVVNWGDSATNDLSTNANPDIFIVKSLVAPNEYLVEGSHIYTEESPVGGFEVQTFISHDTNDTGGGTSQDSNVIIAQALITDPAVNATGNQSFSAVEGAVSDSQTVATFTDPGDPTGTVETSPSDYSASINWGDGTATSPGTITSLGGGQYSVAGVHQYAEEGSYPISVTISHDLAPDVTVTSTATVSDPSVVLNSDPSLPTPTTLAFGALVGVPSAVQPVATFTDPGGPEETGGVPNAGEYTALINWGDGTPQTAGTITFDEGTGLFTVSGSHTYAAAGTDPITVTVSHGTSAPVTGITATATVLNQSSTTPAVMPVSAVEGAAAVPITGLAFFSDPAGAASDGMFTVSIDWGDGAAGNNPDTTSGSIVALGNGLYEVNTTGHSYAEEGSYPVTVTIEHDNDPTLVASGSNTAKVSDPAVVGTGVPVAALEGMAFTGTTVATFTDPGGPETPADYTATINWGDGTGTSTGTISGPDGNGVFTVTGDHTYATDATFNVTVVLTHGTAPNTTVNTTAVVADQSVALTGGFTISTSEGQIFFSKKVATFTDPAGPEAVNNYSASIDWGDGGVTAGVITYNSATQTFSVFGAYQYAEESDAGTPYQITVTVDHGTAAAASMVTATATVAEVPVQALGGDTLTAVEGTVPATAQTVALFTDPAGAEVTGNTPNAGEYSATVTWSDGSTSPGTITFNNGVFSVTATPTASAVAEEGSFAFSVQIDHPDGTSSTTVTGTLKVSDAPLTLGAVTPPTASEGTLTTLASVLAFTDANPNATAGDFTAVISWGDGSTTTVTSTAGADGSVITPDPSGTGFDVESAHLYTEEGTYTISVTVTDVGGATGTASGVATVSDPSVILNSDPAAPTPTTLEVNAVEGQSFTGTVATFTDPGGAEAIGEYAAVIDWGDGTTPTPGSISTDGAGNFTVVGTHTYVEETTTGTPDAITVTVQHGTSTAVQFVTADATVADAAITTPVVSPVTAVEGTTTGPITGLATFSDTAGQGLETAADFTVSIDWGDGVAGNNPDTSGTVTSLGNGLYRVDAPNGHIYAEEGSYTVTVSVTHDLLPAVPGSNSATVSDPSVVGEGGFTLTAVEGMLTTNSQFVALFTDPGDPSGSVEPLTDYTATVNWGDGTTSDSSSTANGPITIVPFGGGVYGVEGNHEYTEEGTYSISVDLHHDTSADVTVTSTATVSDPAVLLNLTALPFTSIEGSLSAVQPVATFIDPGGAEGVSNYSALINWGDGTPPTAGTITTDGSGTFTVSGAHEYTEESPSGSPYQIEVTVDHGDAPTAAANLVQNGGFESGSFAPEWTVVDSTGATNVGGNPHTGNFAANFGAAFSEPDGSPGPFGEFGSISQDIPTVPGNTYTVSYWLANNSNAAAQGMGTRNEFQVSFDGNVISDQQDIPFQDYTLNTFTAVATSFTTTLEFSGRDDPAFLFLDDVSIITPSALADVSDPSVLAKGGLTLNTQEGGTVPAGTVVATFTDPGGAEAVSDYSADIDFGDGNGVQVGAGTVTFDSTSGTFNVTTNVNSGVYAEEGNATLSVTINHDIAPPVTVSDTVGVSDQQLTGLTSQNLPATGLEGASFGPITDLASFTDPAGPELATDYTATINWGDGTTDVGTVNVPTAGDIFTVDAPAHTYAEEGTYSVTVTLQHDNLPAQTTPQQSISIADQQVTTPVVTVNSSSFMEGQASGVLAVATFSDPAGQGVETVADYSATINWGDGTPIDTGTVVADGNGNYHVTDASHTYAEEGTYTVTVSVSHDLLTPAVGTASIMVSDQSVTLNTAPIAVSATEQVPFTGVTVATFTDPAGAEPLSDYSATIDWGDGTPTSTGTITFDAGTQTFSVAGDHTYAEESPTGTPYQITVTVNHDGSAPSTAVTALATVADQSVVLNTTPIAVSALEGTAFTGTTVATFTDSAPEAPANYTATINWGDGTPTTTGVVTFANGVFSVAGDHTYVEESAANPAGAPYQITVTVNHGTATPSTGVTAVATVADQQIVNLFTVDTSFPAQRNEGQATGAITDLASFTDPAGQGNETAADFSATVNWGDGSPIDTSATGVTVVSIGNGNYEVNAPSHTYIEEGNYPLNVTVTHDGLPPLTDTTGARIIVLENGVPFSDSFTGSAGSPLSSTNWTTLEGSFTQDGSGNAKGTGAVNVALVANLNVGNILLNSTVGSIPAGERVGYVVRYVGTTSETASYYQADLFNNGGTLTAELARVIKGQRTLIASVVVPTADATANGPTVLKLVVTGATLQLFANDINVAHASDTFLTYEGGIGIASNANTTFSGFEATNGNTLIPFSDAFTGASGAPLSTTFYQVPEGAFAQDGSGGATALNNVNVGLYSRASAADVSLTTVISSVSSRAGLLARYAGAASETASYYYADLKNTGGIYTAEIMRVVNGAVTFLTNSLSSVTLPPTTVPVTLNFVVKGGSLQLFANGNLVFSTVDTVLSGDGLVGIAGNANTKFSGFNIATTISTLPFSDSFSGSAGSALNSSNYQTTEGSFQQDGSGHAVAQSSTSSNVALYTQGTDDDVSVTATIGALTASGKRAGLLARYSGTTSETSSFYFGTLFNNGGVLTAQIELTLNGVTTFLKLNGESSTGVPVTAPGSTLANPGTLNFTVDGSTLKLSVNGTVVATATDTNLIGAGFAGFAGNAMTQFSAFSIARV